MTVITLFDNVLIIKRVSGNLFTVGYKWKRGIYWHGDYEYTRNIIMSCINLVVKRIKG